MARDDAKCLLEDVKCLLEGARTNFGRDGILHAAAFVFWRKGMAIVQPGNLLTDRDRDMFSAEVRRVAGRLQAHAILFIAESWHVRKTPRSDAWFKEHGSFEGFPETGEVLFAILEMADGAAHWMAPIVRKDGQRPDVGLWEELPKPASSTGRFTHFLSHMN